MPFGLLSIVVLITFSLRSGSGAYFFLSKKMFLLAFLLNHDKAWARALSSDSSQRGLSRISFSAARRTIVRSSSLAGPCSAYFRRPVHAYPISKGPAMSVYVISLGRVARRRGLLYRRLTSRAGGGGGGGFLP